MDEWAEFSKRLKAAMQNAGREPQPGVLHKQFNSRYGGRSVTFQTASGWLHGEGIPRHDKLIQLAKLYSIDPCQLLFGEASAAGRRSRAPGHVAEERATYAERELLAELRALPLEHRQLVKELISSFALLAARAKEG